MANTNKVIWGRELEYVMPRGMYGLLGTVTEIRIEG